MFNEYTDLLSINELQNALGIGRTSAYRLINNGEVSHIRIGKSIRVPKRHLIDFINRSCYHGNVVADLPSVIKEVQI